MHLHFVPQGTTTIKQSQKKWENFVKIKGTTRLQKTNKTANKSNQSFDI